MVIDIGGQDSKIIYLDANYNVKNFTMNDKCAAGTGKFSEKGGDILMTGGGALNNGADGYAVFSDIRRSVLMGCPA